MKKNIKLLSILCCSLLIGTQLNAQCNNPANLDTTFGPQNNGIVFIGTNWQGNGGLLIDDQGRIVSSGSTTGGDFAVARLLSNGILDDTFADNGKTTIDFGLEGNGKAGVVRDCQGRLIVAGCQEEGQNKYVVTRLLENGSLDPSFGTGGIVIGADGNIANISGIKLTSTGKIVLFGSLAIENLIVIQLNSDGSLDSSFGNNGTTEVDFGGTEFTLSDFAIDGQGRIVIVGQTNVGGQNFAVARLNPNGSLDQTFGTNGTTIIDFGGDAATGDITITRAGKIIILGTEENNCDMIIFQLNDNGSLDTDFGNNGFTIVDLPGSSSESGNGGIILDSWGKIYAFGTFNGLDFLIARLEKDGTLDTTFGNNGTKLVPLSPTVLGRGGITIDAQGRIVLLGTSQNPAQFTVVRLCGDTLPAFVVALREKYMANCQCS